jgi:tripartite-type tricarboxylate transporter receptor subunit TctC
MRTLIAILLAFAASLAGAQGWPNRPVRLVVGFPPGGSTDLGARALADKLSAALGQPVVVENRPGASGNIAAEQISRAAPDGYLLLFAATSFASAPAFSPDLTWDPLKDFTPVSLVGTVPIMAVTTQKLPARSLKELIAYSRANPGKMNLGSPGVQTLTRMAGEMFKQTAGLDWVTVHYKGGALVMQDLLAGNVQVMFASISEVAGHVKAGRLNGIAVTTPKRSALLPELPTFAESGYPDFTFAAWQAVIGPAGMPNDVVERLNRDIVRVMSTPEMQERFLAMGTEAATSTPAELQRFIADEVAKIRRIAAGLKSN